MDNLFQYLIWGIIIFSFLSSFFKKKEPPKQNPLPKAKQPESVSYPQQSDVDRVAVSQKPDEYDILRELENLFKGETNIPKQSNPPPKQSRDYIDREIKDEDLDLVVDKRMHQKIEERRASDSKASSERRTTLEQMNWNKKKPVVDPKIEAGAKEFERVLAGPKQQRAAVTEFNRKLKNPRTVREFILFSEILGKPKALRR
ncbi:MAG: OadG family protein [Ignavibacterium sp.]|nr:OadG family protein [Ignavibacterium sp.]